MNNNKLTDERIAELFECVDMCDDMSIDENADMASALRELQQRRLADKNCFMYGIVNPDGQAHMDELCVSCDIGLLETEVAALNSSEGTDGYRVVALYTALPLTDSERIELQERRKSDSEPVEINDDMAYAFHHALSDSSLGSDEIEEIKTGLRAAFANITVQPVLIVPDEIEPDDSNTFDYVDGCNACRAAMLQGGAK